MIIYRFLFLFVLFAISTVAQEREVDFGVVVGVNFSNIATSDNTFDNRTDISAGVALFNPISEIVAMQVELRYSSQGANSSSSSGVDSMLRVDNIVLPLLADFRITDDRLSFQVGPQVGVNIFGRLINDDLRQDINNLQNLQLAGLAGFQYKSEEGLALQLRYALGFTDVFSDGESSKNNVISVSLGYFF